MQTFEFHFSPKKKEDKNFDTFVYEPSSAFEKNLGSLYLVGQATDLNPKSIKIINKIAEVFKDNYYSTSAKTPNRSLSLASKKVNEYLSEEVKKENISWLGNLSFGVISLHNLNINFTKTGDLKIILLRGGQVVDIGRDLELQEIDPYPVKIFFNVVSGQLTQSDKLLIITKELFTYFEEKDILTKIANMTKIDFSNIEKLVGSSKISGACLLSIFSDKKTSNERKEQIEPEKESKPQKKISLLKIKFPKFNILKKFKKKPRITIKPSLHNYGGQAIERFKASIGPKKKSIIAIIFLLAVLLIGFYFFKSVPNKEKRENKISLEIIVSQIDEAENMLIFRNYDEANTLFIKSLNSILALGDKPEIIELKNKIEESLRELNNIEKLDSLTTVIDLSNKSEIDKFKKLSSLAGTSLIFESPNTLYIASQQAWKERTIEAPSFKFNPGLFSSYFSNLYILDRETCDIVKYSHLGGDNWGSPKKWLQNKTDCIGPKSMAINNSVYILNSDNSISVYHSGNYQKTIHLNIFPVIKNLTQIKTKINLDYLYLLEPENKRIIIIDSDGNLIKQIQSDQFNDPLNFDVSKSGKTIYLLDNSVIYKLEI